MSNKRRFCLLVPDKNESMIHKYYLDILGRENCLCIPLWFKDIGRVTAKERREWFNAVVMPKFEDYQCEYLLVCDAECFKVLSGKNKAETSIGYVLDDNDKYYLAYVPTYKTSFKDPIRTKERITLALNGVISHSSGSYKEVGSGIIEKAIYCSTLDEITNNLRKLHIYAKLTCDIETWSLKHYNSGIVSICFCWNENEGLCFRVDNKDGTRNEEVRSILKKFFTEYSGTLIFHNITFDCYILTYQLFMNSLHDIDGMLKGINTLLKNFDDTKLIAYLATNSCAGNQLGLKALAQEYAGDWAEEITNIDEIQEEELLKYNLIDGLATWYVYKKYYKRMIQDEQLEIYQNIFKPACKDIIQMQLTGLPIDLNKVLEAEKELNALSTKAMLTIQSSPLVQEFMKAEAEEWVFMKNQKLKKKKVTVDDFKESFNPSSSLQLQRLLYQFLNLPVLDKTVTDVPATGKKEIEKLINQTDKEEIKELIRALIDWKDVSKILTAFIPAFKKAVYDKDLDCHFLYGSQNLGGTVSGRLSSNSPNLANLPSGSKYGKLIKDCFRAPKGYLLLGLDFNALEARIDALVTKDPNKLDVYIHNYDSHMWNCIHYWPDKFNVKEIEKKEPKEIAKILKEYKNTYSKDRSASKSITFGCQYGMGYKTLMKNKGFNEKDAKEIVENYRKLYIVSEQYKKDRINEASKNGYVIGAFGLKVRTPRIKQTLLNTKVTPQDAEEEKRTAANAIIQSYGLLTTRALIAFMEKVYKSPYKRYIWPANSIHDALYFIIPDDITILLWLNEVLVKEFEWQEDPAIAHPLVHLGGELSLFWPSWANEISIPNHSSKEETIDIIKHSVEEYRKSH